jgi:hypothetical protein
MSKQWIAGLSVLIGIAAASWPAVGYSKAEAKPDLASMIECRTELGKYQSFVLGDFQDESYKQRMGVTKIEQPNFMLNEYKLSKPITVHGYSTSRIAFNSSGIMAVLDDIEPVALAERLKLEVVMNAGTKVLATRTILEGKPEKLAGMKMWRKVSMDLSTVSSHPGKTLVGCTYKIMSEEG